MEAVVRVASRDGFAALTHRAVAEEAGISHGLVRYHFGSLRAAIHEALQWSTDVGISRSSLIVGDDIDSFGSSLSQLLYETPEHSVFQWGLVVHAQHEPELVDEMRGFQDRYVVEIQAQLERFGLMADLTLARTVFSVLNGIVLSYLVWRDREQVDAQIAVLQQMLKSLRDQ